MKKYLLLFTMAFGLSLLGMGQAILYEDFNYTPPANIGGNGAAGSNSNNWTTHNVTLNQTTTIDVLSGNLSYSGLAAPSGNKVYILGANSTLSRDVNRAFTTTNTVLYFSTLITVIDATQLSPTTNDYFMHFGAASGSSVTIFGGRLGIKSVNSAANYRLSIQNTSGGTPTYTEFAQDLTFGTTCLVVVKVDRSVTPISATLWVNPTSLGGAEPGGSVSNSSGTGAFAAFASICIRNSGGTPKAEIDEIRVGPTWADVTPTGTAVPTITVNPTSLTGFTYIIGAGPSAEQSFSINGTSLTADISIVPPANYEISTGSGGTFVPTNPIELTQIAGVVLDTIYVRLKAGLSVNTYNGEVITATSTGASNATVTCSGSVTGAPIPSITVAPASLSGFIAVLGAHSASQNYTVSGDNLTADVTVTAPAAYEVSTDNVIFSPLVVLPQSGGNIIGEPVTVHTRINASAPLGTASGVISHATAGAVTVNVNVTGLVVLPEPSNHAATFTAIAPNYNSIVNTWLDNDGAQPATGFLILANKTGIFVNPVNGVPVTNDANLNDGSGAMNILHGIQTYTWNGLSGSTHFYFAIYAYTNSGVNIKYKTVPAAPAADVFTLVFTPPVAAWTFDSTYAAPNTPSSVAANFGDQSTTAMLYADSTNGSSKWITATIGNELTMFGGATTNDPRETTFAGGALSPVGGTLNSANGKCMVIKFSMSALQNPILTFATRGTGTGFTTHQWAWSVDGLTFTDFGTNTAVNTSTFIVKTLDLSAIDAVDGAPVVYLRITFTGATSASGNNRLDNIVIRASAASNLPPTVVTTAATFVGTTYATLNGTVNANNQNSTVKFAYGLTTTYSDTVAATPPTVTGGVTTPVSVDLTGLTANTTYHFKVIGTNASGSASGNDLNFTTACLFPGDAGQISGPSPVCANLTQYQYSVQPIANATFYVWTFPAGATIIFGEGTNAVTVTYAPGSSSGLANVFGTNDCGDEGGSSQYQIFVNQPLPVSVTITASANPVAAGTTVTFTATVVNGGANPAFQWKVNGTNVGTSSSAFSYIPLNNDEVKCVVTSGETCTSGSPATSNTIIMTVNGGVPENLSVTGVVSSVMAICYNASNTITVAGGSSTFEVQPGGSVLMIAGQKILYLAGTTVQSGGYMSGTIVPGGPYCDFPKTPSSLTGNEETGLSMMNNSFKIYPNPTSGIFTIEQRGENITSPVKVDVLGTLGGKILSAELPGLRKQEISIKGNAPGIYFVKVTAGENVQTVKIILTK
ncbi:MAG: T9SS type A sorting domain-containing protein [Bacteroidetes bacterium]|nr:T9SS type A sorting domain-containing protein [Bacteroidota bacterium]